MKGKMRLNLFWKVVIFYAVVFYGGLVLLFPRISQWVVGAPDPLPMPDAALGMYRILITSGLFVYIASSRARRAAFLDPLLTWFGQGWGRETVPGLHRMLRWAALALLPLVVGGFYYAGGLPQSGTPAGGRIQHHAPQVRETPQSGAQPVSGGGAGLRRQAEGRGQRG